MLRFARTEPRHPDRGLCPACGLRQRHRLLWLYLERRLALGSRPLRVLHFAPEAGIAQRLRAMPGVDYVSGDLEPGRADRQLDLTALELPDAAADLVLCSHVLEHVGDDAAAIRELHRVCAPGGRVLVQSPVMGLVTREDAAERDPAQRRRRFGQDDHVRIYGRDLADRLAAPGFAVDVVVFRDEMAPAERRRFGLGYDVRARFGVDFDAIDEPWEIYDCRRVS